MSPPERRVGDDTAEFRAHTGDDLLEVKYRMQYMEAQHLELRKAVADNTALTINNTNQISNVSDTLNKLADSLKGIIKISNSIDGTSDIAARLGKIAGWLITVSAGIVIIWGVMKYVILEASKK